MKKEISGRIKAGFPILSIETKEEIRTLSTIKEIAKEQGKTLFVWSITRGAICLEGEDEKNQEIFDPKDFLDFVSGFQKKAIFVILDPNQFFEDQVFLRSIKDKIQDFRSGKPILFISANPNIPKDISMFVSNIYSPLPNEDEIKKVIEDVSGKESTQETITSLKGITTDEASDLIALSLVEKKKIDPIFIMGKKCEQIGKKEYLKIIPEEKIPTPEEIGGLSNLKDWIFSRKNAFSQKAKDFGLPNLRGFLLVGVPGCGKSLVAKATASILRIPVVQLNIGAIMNQFVGASEANCREAIQIAESMAPCVLWIDELDKQFKSGGGQEVHEVTGRIISELLNWLQEKTSSVFVIATANNIEGLSNSYPELLRKGRWDEIFFVDLPNKEERKEIFKIHITKNNRNHENFDLDKISEITDKFSGAEIEQVIRESLFLAFENEKELEDKFIIKAIKATNTLQEMAQDKIEFLRNWAKTRARAASDNSQEIKEKENGWKRNLEN
jgi:hypothetical protein